MKRYLIIAALSALVLSGCATPTIRFIEDGNSYTEDSASRLLEESDAGPLTDSPSSDAAKLEHDALVDLRKSGATGATAATLITKTLPAGRRAVTYYVERATFESQSALIVIEATGPSGGKLDAKSLWVCADDGTVLLSLMR